MITLIPESDSDAVVLQMFEGRDARIASSGGYVNAVSPSQRIWLNLQFQPKIGRD